VSAERLRIGVIGLGVGEQHVIAFQAHPECQVVAIADPDSVKRSRARDQWPEVRICENPDDITDDPRIDLVCVASPDDAHYRQILRSLENGKHVFAEKPLCVSEDQTKRIWETLSRAPHLRLSSNTVLRRSPRFVDLRRRIAGGELGRVYFVEADYNYGRLWKLTDGWRGRIPGYSVMLGGGIHMADLILWLTGSRVLQVHAYGTRISSRETGFAGNDLIIATLALDDGGLGKIAVNFGCVEPHFHRVLVYGTEATFENGRQGASIQRSRDPNRTPEEIGTAYPGVAKGALIPSFIDAIRQRGRPDVDENEVFAAMAVCHAVDRSLAECGPAKVAYLDQLPQGQFHA
jgi:predicted dehydrogenase